MLDCCIPTNDQYSSQVFWSNDQFFLIVIGYAGKPWNSLCFASSDLQFHSLQDAQPSLFPFVSSDYYFGLLTDLLININLQGMIIFVTVQVYQHKSDSGHVPVLCRWSIWCKRELPVMSFLFSFNHTHTHSGRAFVYFHLTVLEDLAGADVCLGTHTVTPTLIGPEGQTRGRGAV